MKEMKFGPLLRSWRKGAGLTQEDMAIELKISRPNISKLERDQIELKAADLIGWFQATNAPEIAAAMLCGADITALTEILTRVSTLIGGFILWM